MRSDDELQALATIDPELKQLLQEGHIHLPPPWTQTTDLHAVRALLAQADSPSPLAGIVKETDRCIATRDSSAIPVRVYGGGAERRRPAMLMLHGGGFCVGGLEAGDRVCRVFAGRLGGVAVGVGFRLAPEFPFPTAVWDVVDALRWVANNTSNLGIDPTKGFLLAGESSGADLALAAAQIWHTESAQPPVTGIYCSATSSASRDTVPEKYQRGFVSMSQCAHAPVMTRESCEYITDIYKPHPTSPLAYATAMSDSIVRGMPRTYFQACGLDPLRDCTLVLEEIWRDAGVSTRLDVYAGMPHVFWALGLPASELGMVRRHEKDTEEGLKWLLGTLC
ncbi:Alpha/Beta hydrolase protein [Camillea tinctor]|nr:Alpha/Beta hydrolase protein [Camillea tinctor]